MKISFRKKNEPTTRTFKNKGVEKAQDNSVITEDEATPVPEAEEKAVEAAEAEEVRDAPEEEEVHVKMTKGRKAKKDKRKKEKVKKEKVKKEKMVKKENVEKKERAGSVVGSSDPSASISSRIALRRLRRINKRKAAKAQKTEASDVVETSVPASENPTSSAKNASEAEYWTAGAKGGEEEAGSTESDDGLCALPDPAGCDLPEAQGCAVLGGSAWFDSVENKVDRACLPTSDAEEAYAARYATKNKESAWFDSVENKFDSACLPTTDAEEVDAARNAIKNNDHHPSWFDKVEMSVDKYLLPSGPDDLYNNSNKAQTSSLVVSADDATATTGNKPSFFRRLTPRKNGRESSE